MRKYLKSFVSVASIRFLGSGLSFLFGVAAARLLGAEVAGLYFLSFSVMMFASITANLGFEGTMLRFISNSAAEKKWGRMLGTYRRIILIVGGASGAVALLVTVFASQICQLVFDNPDLVDPLRVMGVAIVIQTMLRMNAVALKGLGRPARSELVGSTIQPATGLVFLYPLATTYGATGVAIAFLISSILAAITGFALWSYGCSRHNSSSLTYPGFGELFDSSRPLWVSGTVNRAIIPWVPVTLLGIWATTSDAGIYAAATRVANLIAMILAALSSILGPVYAELNANNRPEEVGPLSRKFASLTTGIAAPIFIGLFLFATPIMGIFGSEFRAGGIVLVTLSLGQFISSWCGASRMVLIMMGLEKSLRNNSVLSLVVLLTVAVSLIPHYGALGAAIASILGLILGNLVAVVTVYRKLGQMIVPGLSRIFRDRT